MSQLRFVHLSDIHFGQEINGTVFPHEDIRNELIRDAAQQSTPENIGRPNGIIITGDIAYSGKREEYERAGTWLDSLTQAVGCKETDVHVIPGNHDVDLDRIGYLGKMLHRDLRESTTLDADLEGISKSDEAGNPLLPKFTDYRWFAARYGCDFKSAQQPFWDKAYPLDDVRRLRFFGLNSVQVSDKDDKEGSMVLGNSQYVIPRDDNVECVIMMHHPLNWLKDRSRAKHYLRRARVLMVGHEHELEISKRTWDDGGETVEIYAGSTNPPEADGIYEYRYNWLEFNLDAQCSGLIVRVHPRIWERDQTCFISDRNRLQGNDSTSFGVSCPLFSLRTDRIASAQPALSEKIEGADTDESEVGTPEMITEESEKFARLRYFFWKYLDWHTRLGVLVELEILPATMDQPVPQTMERMALDTASRQGKLAELWNAIMKSVPEEYQEANPFESN